MAGGIYGKPILFAIVATLVIMIGTFVTMFLPMLTEGMHPKLDNLKPYTALQLAGKDIYQREGCHYCHTQTVRPLRTEVMRYGDYSKAGEFAYDRPFLWGSKRTGPDLARIGGKYPDAWHYMHFENPQDFFDKSNMPAYGWLKDRPLDPEDIEARMDANRFPHTPDEMSALMSKTELDAIVAYMQVIGTAVTATAVAEAAPPAAVEENPYAGGDEDVAERGEDIYEANCAACHGEEGTGVIGPSLVDNVFLYGDGDVADGYYYQVIAGGTKPGLMVEGRSAKGGMPPFGGALGSDEIWSVITYIRALKSHDEQGEEAR